MEHWSVALLSIKNIRCVLPSKQEPFGAVVCEAMAAGLPVIVSSAVGAARDFVQDEENGYIVPVDHVDHLASKLESLVLDPEKRALFAAASRDKMQKYTNHKLANIVEGVVHDILGIGGA